MHTIHLNRFEYSYVSVPYKFTSKNYNRLLFDKFPVYRLAYGKYFCMLGCGERQASTKKERYMIDEKSITITQRELNIIERPLP